MCKKAKKPLCLCFSLTLKKIVMTSEMLKDKKMPSSSMKYMKVKLRDFKNKCKKKSMASFILHSHLSPC